MVRPKVAVIATVYFPGSHADVIVTRLIEGYTWDGSHTAARVEVVAMYLEQLGSGDDEPGSRVDMGLDLARSHGIGIYPTVGEAIGVGHPGVNVDGVVIIGEHGDYDLNEFGQKLYPRRRLFDTAVATMVSGGRTVPVFSDKGLAWSFTDAQSMVRDAHRLGIPLLAGSIVPLSWRIPAATEWPWRATMTDAVVAGFGPTEMYGFHNLEALQVFAERRAGAETGVVALQALRGEAALDAIIRGLVDPDLLDRALGTFDLDPAEQERARLSAGEVFLIEYADGLRAAVVNCADVIANFGVACRGPEDEIACQIWLPGHPHAHFAFMVRQIESLVLTGVSPYPIERVLLTSGMLDVAMRSMSRGGSRLASPELIFGYDPVERLADTGAMSPLPAGTSPG